VSWQFSKTSSTTCAVFKFSSSAGLRGVVIMTDVNPLLTLRTLSLNEAVSIHHHQTPALTGSEFQGWKLFAYTNRNTPQFSAWQFPLSLPLHINLSPKQHN
jgi:hypothetical protein